MYIKRFIDDILLKSADTHKCILVTGARQVGKSTTLANIFPGRRMVTLDDPFLEQQAKEDPSLFLRLNRPPATIDEIQYAPGLFRHVKMACDRTDAKGLYLLSGSQPYHLMRGVSESLAGRVRIIEMMTLSLREIMGDTYGGHFLPGEKYLEERMETAREPEDVWRTIHRGGYPALQDPAVDWNAYYADYVKTYVERDIRALTAVHDLAAFRRFMVAAASRTGEVLNYSNIASEIGKDVGTVKSWISILETSGIVYLLSPYSAVELKRAIKAPKLYFCDTGLAAYLTRWLTPEALSHGAFAGHIFETFAISEILKSFANEGLDWRNHVSYYRGRDRKTVKADGRTVEVDGEIDLIISENGRLHPVEIKMTGNPSATDAAAFPALDAVKNAERGTGAVVCMCSSPGYLRENLIAMPVWYA